MTRTTLRFAATNALVGLWVATASSALDTSTAGLFSDVGVGVLVATLGAYNWHLVRTDRAVSVGAASINALAGLWLFSSPFVLPGVTGVAMWSDVLAGVTVAAAAGYNVYAGTALRRRRYAPRTA
jgi:hypothetical protein